MFIGVILLVVLLCITLLCCRAHRREVKRKSKKAKKAPATEHSKFVAPRNDETRGEDLGGVENNFEELCYDDAKPEQGLIRNTNNTNNDDDKLLSPS